MKKFLKSHPETLLIVLAIFFLGIIVGYFIWGISDVIGAVNQALTFTVPAEKMSFDIDGASRLNLRGLYGASSTSATALPAAPSATSGTTSSLKLLPVVK